MNEQRAAGEMEGLLEVIQMADVGEAYILTSKAAYVLGTV
jgi:hypothetical protein